MVCFGAATNMAFTTGLIFCFGVLLPVFMDYFKESRQPVGKVFNSTQERGKVQVLFCDKSRGETALLINLAERVANQSVKTLFICVP